jgi:hypothetical protein
MDPSIKDTSDRSFLAIVSHDVVSFSGIFEPSLSVGIVRYEA